MEFLFLVADSWWQVLLGSLAEVGLVFLSALLTVLGGFAIKWIAKKVKITDESQKQMIQEAYDKIVDMGISYAEQNAHKLKDNPKHGSAEKLNDALGFIQKMIEDQKLPEKTADWVEKKIESKLGESKVKAEEIKDLEKK